MSQKLGNRIKENRMRRGLKQEELAEKLFVSRQTISNYENGKTEPDLEMLGKLADALQVEMIDLIGDEKEDSKNDKRKNLLRCGRWFLVLAIYGIIYYQLSQRAALYQKDSFDTAPLLILRLGILPLFYLGAGFLSMDFLSIVLKIKPLTKKVRKITFQVVLMLFVIYLFIILPYLLHFAKSSWELYQLTKSGEAFEYSDSFSFINETWDYFCMRFMYYFILKREVLFIIPGVALRLSKEEQIKASSQC